MADYVVELFSRYPFAQVSYRPNLPCNDYEYEDFSSRKETMDNVMESLKDPSIRVIGVYGMSGIGKTMFAKEASRKALDRDLFRKIVLVVVSHVPELLKIQQEIAEQLGLKLKKTTLYRRADKLRHRLRNEKNILIILDDVWNKLELHEIGISFGSDQKGCKILLTSRFQHVVRDDMGAESFKLKLLSNNESNNLFYKTVRDSARGQDLQLIAEQIIEECACLPIAIVVVATALKNKPCYCWEDALQGLRKPIPMSVEEMNEKVYKSVRLSYDFLANHEAQYLLLLCSIHQEDENINVEDLVKYGIGLDLFQGITNLKGARNRVRKLVYKLKASCLLMESFVEMDKSESFVKMDGVIRDVCLSIASQDAHMHFIRDVDELRNYIEKNELVNSVAISLPFVNVNQLPKMLECSQLKLLLIRHVLGKSHGRLDEQFFEEMKELRVLSLRRVTIKLTCFSQLQNLQTLCLRSCVVGDIAPIGELKKLKILDLQRSIDILQVPREIGQLTLLRSLVLGGCYMIDHVEPHVISSLKNLEELDMESSFSRWKATEVKGEIRNASPTELNDLDQLTTLNVYISDVNSLPGILIKTNLERYQIIIGDWLHARFFEFWYLHGYVKMLKLKLEKSHLVKDHGFENLIKSAEVLYLHGFEDLNDVVLELDKDGFPQLEHFVFQHNESARYIINSSNPCSAFLNLKSMLLENMMNLEKICQGTLTAGSFGKLKKVSMMKCHRIKRLFSFSIAKQFEEIEVQDCRALEEIGSSHESEYESSNANNEASNERKFCQLTTLKLCSLPKVETIFMSEREEGLLNGKVHMPRLRRLEMELLGCKQIWHRQPLSNFNELNHLNVSCCHHLKSLMSYSMATNLRSLKHLEVCNCEKMEEVITASKSENEKSFFLILFPKVEMLKIKDLPKLRRFIATNGVICRSLSSLTLINCLNLTAFVDISTHAPIEQALFVGKAIFPSLVSLEVNHREILNEIFNSEGKSSVNSFGMLERLCLGSVLPLEVVQRFQNLKELSLSGIASEKLFQHQELRAAEENENILPHLKTLVLKELPKLLHMFDEDVLTKVISNLEIVDIIRCDQLKSFIPPSMSFQYYLKTLRVTECHGLKNLFASSVVKGLVNLKKMSIYGCEGMMEIVGKDEVELVSEIVFQKLETLALHNLPNLKCFYCENSTLTFPNLKTLVVSQCPEMQAFSHGIVNSPILDKVITEYNWNYYYKGWEGEMIISHHFKGFKYGEVKEECWENNINDTVQKIFELRSQFNQS